MDRNGIFARGDATNCTRLLMEVKNSHWLALAGLLTNLLEFNIIFLNQLLRAVTVGGNLSLVS
jgi:hypothetical protein